MKHFLYISLCALAVILTGCEGGSYGTSASASVARLRAFGFAKNDTMPGLHAAVFTVEERNDTGLVWNKDSILYGTSLEHVAPRMTFAATPGAAWIKTPDTVCTLTGYDTLDFSKQPIYLTILSSDKTVTKTYEIKASVHQQDPDMYTWETLAEGFYDTQHDEQRVLELQYTFVLLSSNGSSINVYQSNDGAIWNDLGPTNGLPAGAKIRQVISDGEQLYYGEGNTLYTSTDAVSWTAHTVEYTIQTMLMYWNKQVWALIDNNGYQFAYWKDDELQTIDLRPTSAFPVRDFATVDYLSSSLREHALILGGKDKDGETLNTRWYIEYSSVIGYRLQEFSLGRDFPEIADAAVVAYKNQLLLFGGADEQGGPLYSDIMVSADEGLNWTKADSTKNRLPEQVRQRKKQSAIVRDNYIYLFGGQDDTDTYSDVYRGKLNSIDW